MSAVRIAVIIPCFNDGQFLDEAVNSALQQEPCEIIVVNDGSTDQGTLRCLRQLEQRGVHVLHQENMGLSEARMTGVRCTSAQLVFPLDADDRLAPQSLTALADALDQNADASVAWGDYRMFGASSNFFPGPRDLDPWRITYVNEVCGSSMIRRDTLLEVGGWNMGSGYEDWDLWMKLAESGVRGVRVHQLVLNYRVSPEPRMYAESLNRTAQLRALLEERHKGLYAARRVNRALSGSPWPVRAIFPAIDRLPLVPELQKQRLYALVKYLFDRESSSPDFRGPATRVRRLVTRGVGRMRRSREIGL